MIILNHIFLFLTIISLIFLGRYVNFCTRKIGYKKYTMSLTIQKIAIKARYFIAMYFMFTLLCWLPALIFILKTSFYDRPDIYLILVVKIIILIKYLLIPDIKEGYFIFYCGLLILVDWIVFLAAQAVLHYILFSPNLLYETRNAATIDFVQELYFMLENEITCFNFFCRSLKIIKLGIIIFGLYFIRFFPLFFLCILYYIYIIENRINNYDDDDDEYQHNNF